MENKDTAQYIMQELAKFLTPEELVKISVNEIANKTNSIGFFKKNNYWFIYKNDDRMYTSYFGPYDPEHLVYNLCLEFNRESYNYSIEEAFSDDEKVFTSLKEIDDYTKTR